MDADPDLALLRALQLCIAIPNVVRDIPAGLLFSRDRASVCGGPAARPPRVHLRNKVGRPGRTHDLKTGLHSPALFWSDRNVVPARVSNSLIRFVAGLTGLLGRMHDPEMQNPSPEGWILPPTSKNPLKSCSLFHQNHLLRGRERSRLNPGEVDSARYTEIILIGAVPIDGKRAR